MGVALALVLGGLLFGPPTPEDVRTATRRVFEDARWQKDLPHVAGEGSGVSVPVGEEGGTGDGSGSDGSSGQGGHVPEGRGRSGHGTGPSSGASGRPPPRPTSDAEPPDLPPPTPPPSYPEWLVRVIAWGALAVIVVLVVVGAVGMWRSRDRTPPTVRGVEEAAARAGDAPAFPRGRVPGLDEADALAAKGLYADAIHLLLQRAFAVLQSAGRADAATTSLTSREVLAKSRVGADLRDALGGLVTSVEVSRFGGIPIDEPEWRASRDRYERLATATPAAAS